ncbi:Threonine/homoserine/homoserine lactone efflux protein [Enhydrobacter aerosaccus]|uniref:Threonine/homoserine/homoserine lactone efflux protein n=1 Tax=Enhydrobacter aerosaccus TaxID=225324 RepID=A0A1T4SZZ7_9HYPH|nr:LysE family translocator [Enhydrobacter aerosaccus]SKA33709.1 Threonine/homoserine/homoserine lactone efflux protein [Enhydrobacter aerosaccus]
MDAVVALLGLAVVHLLAAASPGPSFVLVAQTAVGSGRRAGFLAAFAMMLGALAWAAAALYGLQVLFARFEWLYLAMRIGGGLYLLYLAVMLWRHARDPLPEPGSGGVHATGAQGFVRALLLQLSNPKVMVFFGSIFLALLPAQPPVWMQAAVLAIVAFNEFTWYALITLLFSGGPARAIYRRAKVWLDRIMGGALAVLGLRLALLSR